ncbi:hypothetical protein HK100_002470, partial [Physocladia obscura]
MSAEPEKPKQDVEKSSNPDVDDLATTVKVDAWGVDIIKTLVSLDDDPTEPVGGLVLAKVLPKGILNPGKFTKKELTLIVISSSTAAAGVNSTLIIGAKNLYFDQQFSYVDGVILTLVTQFIGYGAVGIFRSVLVYPRKAFYPTALSRVALLETLFSKSLTDSAFKMFWFATGALFVWTFLPQYLAPTLIGISILCIANQHSPLFTQLFGGVNNNEGLGIFSFSLDWNNIGDNGLTMPWVTQVNQMIGMVGCVVVIPIMYYANVWNAKTFPFMAQGLYRANGTSFKQANILTNNTLDEAKYAAYGQPYYSVSWAFNTMMQNMSVTAGVVHVILWHGPEILAATKSLFSKKAIIVDENELDVTYHLTAVHPEVPHWWYGILMLISVGLGFYVCIKNDNLSWWAFIIAVVIAIFFIIVSGLLTAVTGFTPPFKTFIQLLGGFMIPGKPIANMYFTTFGSNITSEAVSMLLDLKLGQYLKVPPRAVFWSQLHGGFIGALVHYILNEIILRTKRDILLDPNGDNNWSGQNIIGFNTKAITFGTLAPKILAAGGTYEWLSYAFIVGAFVPIPFWLAHRFFPKIGFNMVNTSILTWYFCIFTVGVNSGWWTRNILGFVFQLYLRKYRSAWFNKYTYVLAAGLNAGTQLAVFVMSFAFQGAGGVTIDPPFWFLNPDPATG